MNINGIGTSAPQNPTNDNSKDLEQEIKKLQQKKSKLEQDKKKAENPFSTAPSKEAAEIDKKIKDIDKQIQQLKTKATTSLAKPNNQNEPKEQQQKVSAIHKLDEFTRSQDSSEASKKSISGVYNTFLDESGSQTITLTPFLKEDKE